MTKTISFNKKIMRFEDNRIVINKNIIFLIGIFLILAFSAAAQQTLPTLISLQGKLTNTSTGATIVTANLRVNISDSVGNTLWNETFQGGVSNGFFDLLLGSSANNPLNLTFNQDYNISIYVGDSQSQIGGTYRFRSGIGGINPSNITAGNFSAAGNFTFGSVMHIDKTNNRLGIGTMNPAEKLEVAGDVIIGTGSIRGLLKLKDLVGASWNITTANYELEFINDSGSVNMVIEQSGKVGIGTTGPLFKTHVASDVTMDNDLTQGTAQLSVGGGTTIDKRLLLGYDTNGNGFGFIKAGYFGVGWTLLALQPNGGDVGIGTNAPTKKLSVNGTLNAFTVDPSASDIFLNTTADNLTITSATGSVIIQLG